MVSRPLGALLTLAGLVSGCNDELLFPALQDAGGTGGGGGTHGTGGGGGGAGAPGAAGAAGLAGAAGFGEEPALACEFDVEASLSEVIPTVGIVTWTVNLPGLSAAQIEFGPDTDYGLLAPVDLEEPGHRTLLLGMKPSRQYHFRVRATQGEDECVSRDYTLTTGPLRNNLGAIDIETPQPEALAGGFMVTVDWSDGPAFILDSDGDYVWWYDSHGVSRARMSYDGKYMWLLAANPTQNFAPDVRRVTMDGLKEEQFPEFGDAHHDLAPLPDGNVAFIQRTEAKCDRIMEWSNDGSVREVVDVGEAHGGGGNLCHTNSLSYSAEDDTFTFSDLFQNTYVNVTRDGEVRWVLGGSTSDFTGDGASWVNEHGHHLFAEDRLLFFNNAGAGNPSKAIEVSLDFDDMTAAIVWEYHTDLHVPIFGDVQRLDNGNTLVTFSVSGVIHEVDPEGHLVRSLGWPLGTALGYLTQRPTLYGPPPK